MSQEPDPRRGVPSCSQLERLHNCPASWHLGIEAEKAGMVPPPEPCAEAGKRIARWRETGADEDWLALSHDEQETASRCEGHALAVMREYFDDSRALSEYYELRLGLTPMGAVIPVTPDTKAKFLITGQADKIVTANGRALVIDDKSGRLEVTRAPGNMQLMGLAALAGEYFQCDQVRVAIVQPWCGPPSLAQYGDQELESAVALLIHTAQNAVKTGHTPKPGTWCIYCPARAICPALKSVGANALERISPLTLPAVDQKKTMMARLFEWDGQEVGDALREARLIGWYLDSLKAVARVRLEQGKEVEGYELRDVPGKRAITDPKKAAELVSPFLVGAQGGSAAALLRACHLRPRVLQEEIQRASGPRLKKDGQPAKTGYAMTGAAAKELLAGTLGGLMEQKTRRVLAEAGAVLADEDQEGGES